MNIIGFLLGIGSALFRSGTDITTKIAGKTTIDARIILLIQRATGSALLLIIMFFLGPFWLSSGEINSISGLLEYKFFILVLINSSLTGLAFYFYIQALKHADVSLVAPITLFTPALLLITSPIMLGESIPLIGMLGVILIVIGGYLIGLTDKYTSKDILGPIVALANNKGSRFMFATAFIWSITSNIDKLGVLNSSPLIWVFGQGVVLVVALGLFLLFTNKKLFHVSKTNLIKSSLPGFTETIGTVLQMFALTIIFVPYVIALKRTSVIFSVIAGKIIFKEENIKERMLSVFIMLLGVILIVFSQI